MTRSTTISVADMRLGSLRGLSFEWNRVLWQGRGQAIVAPLCGRIRDPFREWPCGTFSKKTDIIKGKRWQTSRQAGWPTSPRLL